MIQSCADKNKHELELLAEFLKVVSEENRLRIICFLQKKGEQCVCEIWKFLDLPQNLVSHHLKILKNFGLLDSRQDGLKVCYCIDTANLEKYKAILNKIIN